MKKMLLVLMGLVAGLALTACNTMAGLGQDVQKVGEKVEDAANKKR